MAKRMRSFGVVRRRGLEPIGVPTVGARRGVAAGSGFRDAGVAAKLMAWVLAGVVLAGVFSAASWGSEPTAALSFLVVKEDNGKPIRNAAVVLHPVNSRGKQGRGGFELKTDSDGKTHFEGVPYGKMRVQVLAPGFQTYGDDFDIGEPEKEITVKLKRQQKQYSIYENGQGAAKKDVPPEKKD